jgi:Protein of unknown function (DUF664)
MYEPASNDEITGLVNYLDEQLTAIRAAAIGLTDEQARLQPCRSTLSVGGLIKHATYVMRGAMARVTGERDGAAGYDEGAYAAYESSFALGDGETAVATLADFDAVRVAYLATLAALDPDGPTVEPPAPWFGIFDARPANVRYYLVHQVEEMARHAGHADIIREQVDGVAIPQIVLSQAGAPANDFFPPYEPAPGTIGGPPA